MLSSRFPKLFQLNSHFVRLQSTAINVKSAPTAVDMKLLQRLRRDNEGLPISRVKEALLTSANDYEQAQQWLNERLRKDGLKKAVKVQNRQAEQGYVIMSRRPPVLLELNCETDFVAKNEVFQRLALSIGKRFQQNCFDKNSEIVAKTMLDGSDQTVKTSITDSVALLGENIQLRKVLSLPDSSKSSSILGTFVHGKVSTLTLIDTSDNNLELGKIGAIVQLEPTKASNDDQEPFEMLAKQLAQHVVGMNPRTVQELESQPFLFNPDITVHQLLSDNETAVKSFIRLECGQKEQQN